MCCPLLLSRLRIVFPIVLALTVTLALPAAFLPANGDLDVAARVKKSR